MPENYNGSGGYQKSSLTIEIEVLVYELDPEYISEFHHFYDDTIRPWLAQNKVPDTNAWIAGNYLIVVALLFMPPWIGKGGIPGLDRYLKQKEPVQMKELRNLTVSQATVPASYAKKSA